MQGTKIPTPRRKGVVPTFGLRIANRELEQRTNKSKQLSSQHLMEELQTRVNDLNQQLEAARSQLQDQVTTAKRSSRESAETMETLQRQQRKLQKEIETLRKENSDHAMTVETLQAEKDRIQAEWSEQASSLTEEGKKVRAELKQAKLDIELKNERLASLAGSVKTWCSEIPNDGIAGNLQQLQEKGESGVVALQKEKAGVEEKLEKVLQELHNAQAECGKLQVRTRITFLRALLTLNVAIKCQLTIST